MTDDLLHTNVLLNSFLKNTIHSTCTGTIIIVFKYNVVWFG